MFGAGLLGASVGLLHATARQMQAFTTSRRYAALVVQDLALVLEGLFSLLSAIDQDCLLGGEPPKHDTCLRANGLVLRAWKMRLCTKYRTALVCVVCGSSLDPRCKSAGTKRMTLTVVTDQCRQSCVVICKIKVVSSAWCASSGQRMDSIDHKRYSFARNFAACVPSGVSSGANRSALTTKARFEFPRMQSSCFNGGQWQDRLSEHWSRCMFKLSYRPRTPRPNTYFYHVRREISKRACPSAFKYRSTNRSIVGLMHQDHIITYQSAKSSKQQKR